MTTLETIVLHYLLPIGVAFLIALIIQRLSHRIVGRFMGLSYYAPESIRLRQERQRTLHDLFASSIGFLAFLLAAVFSVSLFVDTTTLVWILGLFAAGFGLGARPLISDFLTGVSFIFEDTFDVGEKVELLGIEGVLEKINLRTVFIRSPTGELYIIPNGEIRVIRNFSRGRFSSADVSLKVSATDLEAATQLLEDLSAEAVELLPNLLEPWQVISRSENIGQHAELSLMVKTRFGKAAELRPRMVALVHERLSVAGIDLHD